MTDLKTLAEWRIERKMSLDELAQASGVDRGTLASYSYSNTPTRKRMPSMELGLKIAAALGVSPAEINWGVNWTEGRDAGLPEMPVSPAFNPSGPNTPRISEAQLEIAAMWLSAGRTKAQIAQAMGVSRQALYGAMSDSPLFEGEIRSRNRKPQEKPKMAATKSTKGGKSKEAAETASEGPAKKVRAKKGVASGRTF